VAGQPGWGRAARPAGKLPQRAYESRPLPYAESAYGLPETGQEIINVTNGKLIRLFVDDEPFDVRDGELRSHERLLDFRAGVLHRRAEWVSPAGRRVRVSSARLVSFAYRAVAAVCYEVEPLEGPVRIAVQVGAGMDHLIDCPAPVRVESRVVEDGGLVTLAAALEAGQTLRVIKFAAYS
jgi:trehalose/maltose hydrolase-like predicted phosphorylase